MTPLESNAITIKLYLIVSIVIYIVCYLLYMCKSLRSISEVYFALCLAKLSLTILRICHVSRPEVGFGFFTVITHRKLTALIISKNEGWLSFSIYNTRSKILNTIVNLFVFLINLLFLSRITVIK